MVVARGTGPSKDSSDQIRIRKYLDGARNSRSFGGFWQHMLVAEGAIEAALDWTSKPWDLSPLILIVTEAGGKSTSLNGNVTIFGKSLLSRNGKLLQGPLGGLRNAKRKNEFPAPPPLARPPRNAKLLLPF